MYRFAIFAVILSSTLFAHKINLFLYDEAGKLYVQSYFTKSSPCKACEVVLLDKEGKELIKDITDEEGTVTISLPAPAFTVVVKSTMGHQQEAFYEAQTHATEEAKALPQDTQWQKILLALGVIAGIFSILHFVKRS